MTTLTELANKFGTDKGTISQAGHSYTTIYDLLLNSRRDQALNILEIGLSTGGPELGNPADRAVTDIPSVKMWHEFFPNAKIYGIDISDFSQFRAEWFYFIQADCGDERQLEKAADLGINFDIIVDDGSHASFHQQLTLLKLFATLKSGGLYIIEDLDWQPRHYEQSLPSAPTTVAQLRSFIKNGSFIGSSALPAERWTSIQKQISNVFLLDDDELYGMRRIYNRQKRIEPQNAHYYDSSTWARLLTRGYARRMVEGSAEFLRAVTAQYGPLRRSRVKLGIIHKA